VHRESIVIRSWDDEFGAFAERKTREAIEAVTPPYSTEFISAEPDMIAVGNSWSGSRFDGAFYVTEPTEDRRPACSLVFVQTADGNTGATDPGSLGGGDTDKHVVYEGLSRVAADAVLVGANTMRDDQFMFSVWHPELVDLRRSLGLPRHPAQIVATLAGLDLTRSLIFNMPSVPVFLVTSPDGARQMKDMAASRPWIRLITLESPNRLEPGMQALGDHGLGRISCVGGRTLADALLVQQLIDDVYITTSPQQGGEPNTPISNHPLNGSLVMRKHGSGAEAGVIFEHLHLHRR
jgi:riboflavin biosynthesis pyrimidine reductase